MLVPDGGGGGVAHTQTHTTSPPVIKSHRLQKYEASSSVTFHMFRHSNKHSESCSVINASAPDAHKQHDSLQTLTYYLESWWTPARGHRGNACVWNIQYTHLSSGNVNGKNIRLLQRDKRVCWYVYVCFWLITLRHDELFLVFLQSNL